MIQIFATFEYSVQLELAINALEQEQIQKESIFTVPLTYRKMGRKLFDTMHSSDGVSFVSTGAAIGTAFAAIGASIGFSLKWGPIYWGLIGATAGFLLGVVIDLFINFVIKKPQRRLHGKKPQVIIIVECHNDQADTVENILWHFLAFGLARVESEH